MTQSKTSLILNNLVELKIPTCTDSKYLQVAECPKDQFPAPQTAKDVGMLSVKLHFPFTFLLQKVCLEESNKEKAGTFQIQMITKNAVSSGKVGTSVIQETEIIDFKKEKIDWRFKTRMRSNSNEFLDSPLAFVQKLPQDRMSSTPQIGAAKGAMGSKQEPVDSEDLSILSSDEEVELKQDGKLIVLGNAISNQFTLYLSSNFHDDSASIESSEDASLLSPKSSSNKNNSKQRLSQLMERFCMAFSSIKLFVWPTFRLPTGSSVIALINTSFLFATKRLEQERLESDFLVALSLISGRKFIQASEKLRKIQSHLLCSISVKSLLQAMNIEMIIGESMNQHSQISEKMFAFHRAVLFYKVAKRVERNEENGAKIDVEQVLNSSRNKSKLKQEEAYKYLLRLQPHLVEVLLMNIDSHIQAVRMASLKTLEFLFDTLGCNLDDCLISILIAIIKTYPSMTKRSTLPKDGHVVSFFEDSWQQSAANTKETKIASGRQANRDLQQNDASKITVGATSATSKINLNRFQPAQLVDLASQQHSTFFSLNDIHSLKDCQVKDASLFHQSLIQTSKNFYNHILESMVFLISSTSTPILVRIFNEVIQKVLFQESIEQDLQVYLLRLSERILQLCQGYVQVNSAFLNTLFEMVLARNSSDVQVGPSRANSADDQVTKAANELWHTLKSSYLLNQSGEGISTFISWVACQFNSLTEKVTGASTSGSSNRDSSDYSNPLQPLRCQAQQLRDATLSVTDQQKLLLLLDLTNLLIFNQMKLQKRTTTQFQHRDRKNEKKNLKKLAERDLLLGISFNSDQDVGDGLDGREHAHGETQRRPSSQLKLLALKMCQLIEPVIFWLNFSIEKPDRLNYFKAIWSTLTKLVQILPKKRSLGIDLDCIQIIIPTLQRVENFCKTSSPSLEMLQFLIVVFVDIKNILLQAARKRTKRDLFSFLQSFIVTFAQNIPHNLHDEVFEVCSLLIDLVGENGLLTQHHVKEVLEALVHKYTMRSKAHKRLSDQFLQRWILDQSLMQLEELKKLEYQIVDEQQMQQTTRPRTYSNGPWVRPPIQLNPYVAPVNAAGGASVSSEGQKEAVQHQTQAMPPTQSRSMHGWNQGNEEMQQQVMIDNQSNSNDDQEQLISGNNFGTRVSYHQEPAGQATQRQSESQSSQHELQHSEAQNRASTTHPQRLPFSNQGQNFMQQQVSSLTNGNVAPNVAANSVGNDSTQAIENGSNRAPNLDHNMRHQNVGGVGAIQTQLPRSLYFDTLCDFCLFNNFLTSSDQFVSEQDQEQIHFEKLSVLQDLIEASKEAHNSLFKRLLHHTEFSPKIASIFTRYRARAKIVKLVKAMTAFFLKFNSPKTFYEHPIVQTSAIPVPLSQPQPQPHISARYQQNLGERGAGTHSQLQFGGQQQLHSEPSMDLLHMINQEDNNDLGLNVHGNGASNRREANHEQHQTSTQEQIREQDLNLRRMNHHYSQYVERQQNFLFNFGHNEAEEVESPHLAPSNVNTFLFDEVNLINNERLILIKTFTVLIRIQIEELQADQEKVSKDSHSQLQALTMLDMLLFSLCPVPSFQNIVIRHLLSPDCPGGGPVALQNGVGAQANNGSEDLSYQIAHPHRLSFQFTGLNSMFGSQLGISNQEQHNDAIPDFETMLICEKLPFGLSETQPPVEPNSFPKEFECWDIRYQHSRLALAFKFWPFVEDAVLNSSWNNVKAACYSVLSKAVQIPDVTQMSANYQKRLKDLLFPLLHKLLKSKESEGRAAGLNILGSFCGLANLQRQNFKHSLEFSREDDESSICSSSRQDAVFDSDQGQDYDYARYEQKQKEALTRNQIKVREHLHVFRRNSQFVSLAIWQEVFDLQENWNQQIKDAAVVLTQLCAPKDSVVHFKKMSDEKFSLKLSEAQKQLKNLQSIGLIRQPLNKGRVGSFVGQGIPPQVNGLLNSGRQQFNSQSVFNGLQSNEIFSKQSSQQILLSAHAGANHATSNAAQFNHDFNLLTDGSIPAQTGKASGAQQNQQENLLKSQNEENKMHEVVESEDSSSDNETDSSHEPELFFMENLSEKQLQQAISLFNAEFRPISSLWIDRTSQTNLVKSNKLNRLSLGYGGGGISGFSSSASAAQDDDYIYNELHGGGNAQQNLLIDFFEDNMLEEVASLDSKEDEASEKAGTQKDSNQLASGSGDRHQSASQSDGEDLGIIDLDKQEGSEYDDFDQLDDEKLPVLKNTYSKKNRPNNSKSVAIGSRSQGDVLRIRSQALQVLKAADEEIKVQIQEHPEMLSGLQRSFASHKSHEKQFNLDLLEERRRCVDDCSLNKLENYEWISSLSESADRMQKKRRIQSGKAQSVLSEDCHVIDRQHSQYSKTDSSNASQSTPMEIGDIQIIMQQDATNFKQQQNQKYRIISDREKVMKKGDRFTQGEQFEIRSQDNKHQRQVRKRQQRNAHQGDLSGSDTIEKVSDPDDREEVISAPVKGHARNTQGRQPSSAYKISDGSLTELSSPFGDEASSSNKTLKEENDPSSAARRKSVKTLKQHQSQTKNGTNQEQQHMTAGGKNGSSIKKDQRQQQVLSQSMQSRSSNQPAQIPMHGAGSSSYLQSVSRQNLATAQQAQQKGQNAAVQQRLQISGKVQTNQSKYPGRESGRDLKLTETLTRDQKSQQKSASGRGSKHPASQQQQLSTSQQQQQKNATLSQSQLKLIQGSNRSAIAGNQKQQQSEYSASMTTSTKVASSLLQKSSGAGNGLSNVQSQSVMLINSQRPPSMSTKQSASKKQIASMTNNNRPSRGGTMSSVTKQEMAAATKDSGMKRPNSLVLRHMPPSQSILAKQPFVKRNNFIAPPQQMVSPRNSKKDGGNSSRSMKHKITTGGHQRGAGTGVAGGDKQRQSRQAELLKYKNVGPQDGADDEVTKYIDDEDANDLRLAEMMHDGSDGSDDDACGIDDNSDPVEDLI